MQQVQSTMNHSAVDVFPSAMGDTREIAEPKYKTGLNVQGTNLYKLHVGGDDAMDMFPLDTDINQRPHSTKSLLHHSRPSTSLDGSEEEDDAPGLHSRLDTADDDDDGGFITPASQQRIQSGSRSIMFQGKIAPQMNEKLSDGSYKTNHGRKRRGGVSGRSTNTILNKDGSFITDVDTQFKVDVEVAKSVIQVDKRNVHEKVDSAVGTLNFPPGLRSKTPNRHKGDTDLDKRLVGMPGGLHLSKKETCKYFGAESRVKFFERSNYIKNQRTIASVDCEHVTSKLVFDNETAGGNINSDHNIKNDIDKDINDETSVNALAAEIPFYPIRVENSLKVNTKVIIRTQSLDVTSDEFTQLKLIPKPASVELDDDIELSTEPSANVTQSPSRQPSFSDNNKDSKLHQQSHHHFQDEHYNSAVKNIDATMRSISYDSAVNARLIGNLGMPPINSLIFKKPFSLLDPITPREVTPVPKVVSSTPSSKQSNLSRRASKAVKPSGDTATVGSNSAKNGNTGKSRKAIVHLTPIKATNAMKKKKDHSTPSHPHPHHDKPDLTVTVDTPTSEVDGIALSPSQMIQQAEHQQHNLSLYGRGDNHSIHQSNEPLQFICIDHRDNLHRNVKPKSAGNSLFKYVSAKQASQFDFTNADKDYDSDEDLGITKEELAIAPVNNDDGPLSPRSQYIDSCIRKQLNPRASLILRKKFTKQLSLQHHGIGDEMMCLFADAIINIPYIQSLNIADNNLTDKSLGPIVLAVVKMKELIDLNISFNTIGPVAATSLAQYLSDPTCPLERLVLRRADIDDGECERFVTALKTNQHLKELDLSENLIGISENLNSVMPDIVTGGEALADLLRSGGCVLTSLRLGWNMLRLDGAADFCNSLKTNATLTYLDLSFNSLGSVGGIALGDALQDNKTLHTLFISNNSIDSMACLTICAGILENEALQFVAFDGNPIGEVGARALMLLPTMVGSRVKLSAAACNIGIKDPRCWFDSTQLLRKFELKLEEPFDRAIALFLMCLIAAHQTYFIAHSEWYDSETKTTTNLGLSEHVVVNFESKRLDADQLALIESLRIVKAAASNITKALELFKEIDEDGSGQLDKNEFGHLMECMGMEMGKGRVEEIMAEYDVDGGGFIELPEFLLFLKNQLKEANVRLKELSEFPVMSVNNNDGKERERYVPPRHGILKIIVQDGFTQKSTYRVINGSDKDYIIDIARQSGDLLKMAQFGVQSYKVRFPEAMSLTEQLLKENSNKTQVLSKVLPQIAKASDARLLVSKILGGNKGEIQRLKREIGPAIRPMLGNCDGYYILDLSNPMDKICLNKLLEIGMTSAFIRGKTRSKLGFGALGDCSQRGNWSAFRNEVFNGKPITITTEFATPMPRSGKLEFDFVSERRIEKDMFVLNDVRFTNLLTRNNQLLPVEREDALGRLAKVKKASDLTLNGDARTVFECPLEKAEEISQHMAIFYDNITLRSGQVEKFRQKESIKVNMEFDPTKIIVNVTTIRRVYCIPTMHVPKMYRSPHHKSKKGKIVPPPIQTPITPNGRQATPKGAPDPITPKTGRPGTTPKSGRTATLNRAGTMESAESLSDDDSLKTKESEDNLEEMNGDDLSSVDVHDVNVESSSSDEDEPKPKKQAVHADAADNGLNFPRKPITLQTLTQLEMVMTKFQEATELDEFMNRYVCIMGSSNVQVQAKAARQLELLIDMFEHQFFFARHLELLLDLFREVGSTKTSEFFGTYRVELVVNLFACVVDIHNFEVVLRSLTAFEVACVYCRLGWLHLYNPMKPEGAYELDLSRREERQIVKTLTQLATAEPGDNLPTLAFRWERDMATMPGYELTEPWMTEDGLPRKGLWTAFYYSGEGTCKKGCKPYVKLRRSMLQMVFINEADVVLEADRDSDNPPPLAGEAFMMANLGMWYGYLAYNEDEYKAIKSKKAADAAAAAKLAKKRK